VTKKDSEFIKLQKRWYAKLKKEGFDDIEWTDHKTGYGQDSPHLKRSTSYIASKYSVGTENYYRLFRNFVSHATFTSKIDQTIAELHSEGFSYREILKQIRLRHRRKRSLYFIWSRMKVLTAQMLEFNKTHEEGLLREPEDLINGA
jgi:hypothetical protein